jgi:hypothetical protein
MWYKTLNGGKEKNCDLSNKRPRPKHEGMFGRKDMGQKA